MLHNQTPEHHSTHAADAPVMHASPEKGQGVPKGAVHTPEGLWVYALGAMFDTAAARFPNAYCCDFMDKKYTYAEIAVLVNRTARGLQQLGVRKGTKVGLCLPNTPYFIVFYYAVLKVGGIVVNYNPLYVARELSHQISDSGTEFMVTMDLVQIYEKLSHLLETTSLKRLIVCPMADILPTMKSLLFSWLKRNEISQIPVDLLHVPFRQLIANDGSPTQVVINPAQDIALLQYTGGTTGVPKGAMLTHANLSANAEQIRERMGAIIALGQERMLAVLPFFHVFAMTVTMNTAVRIGAEMLLLPRFELSKLLKLAHDKRPTLFPGVPTIYTAISNAEEIRKYDLTSIKFCISGGAPLPQDVKDDFESLTGCRLVEGYGLTESAPVATCNLPDDVRAGSIGVPVFGTQIRIAEPGFPDREKPTGVKGEVCIKGPQVMAGYWRRPDATRDVLVDGWLRTGDIGYKDEAGYVYLVDRIKDVILCSGYNVYPRVIEEALYQHPHVMEAIVIGVDDEYRGQAPKAFVTLHDDANEDTAPAEIMAFLKDHLSKIEMPKAIEVRESLPKTMVGKLSKKELVEEEKNKQEA
jgi:long-chain acyl-CoA synthetase